MHIPDPLFYAVPFFVVLIVFELVVLVRMGIKYDYQEALASIKMGLGVAIFNVFSKGFYVYFFFVVYEFRFFEFLGPPTALGFYDWSWHLGHWWVWLLVLVGDDLTYYWFHRSAHEIRVLWAGHVNHHSSRDYNLATAVRQGWWEILYKYSFWSVLPLIGFHPFIVLTMFGINSTYQFFLHTEMIGKLGLLEEVLCTPSHHRVHHSSNIKYLDKNYGGIFIIWDRIFGTFEREEEDPEYGLVNNISTKNPFKIASHELIALAKDLSRARNWNQRIRYLFDRPGWSHDGDDLRVETLRKNSSQNQNRRRGPLEPTAPANANEEVI